MIDCGGNTAYITQTWCDNIFGYTLPVIGQHQNAEDYVPVAAPSQTPPVVTGPGPQPMLSIRPGSISRSGTSVQMQLIVANSGTQNIASVTLSSLALRTLAGAGEATLAQPSLPVSIGPLDAGQTSVLALTLNVPLSVKKLQLTESGTVNSGGSPAARFSFGQVIFP